MTVTTVTLTQPENNGADTAAIVAWGSAISSLFSGAGLVQTADTGQINWATAAPTYATSGDTSVGDEIWAFNDSLQATAPIYVHANYRHVRTTAAHNYFYVYLSVGVATDGAGALTTLFDSGVLSPQSTTSSTVFPYGGSPDAWSSGDGSYLSLAIAPLASGTTITAAGAGICYVDRTRDSTGAITAEGLQVGWLGYFNAQPAGPNSGAAGNTGRCSVFNFQSATITSFGGTTTGTGVTMPAYVPGSLASGTTVGFQAPSVSCNGKRLPPILAAVAYYVGDITTGTVVTLPVSGSNHSYYCLGSNFCLADRLSANTNAALALRYE